MKLLGNMLFCAACVVLAGCSQEALELAQRDISRPPQPETPPAKVEPNPESNVPILPEPPAKGTEVKPPVQPLPATAETPEVNPPETNPAEPKEPKPPTEPKEPAEPELTPEEIKNRKLISDDPRENLEVLNEALDAWLATHDELPEKVADLVMGEHLPMLPMAPAGQHFEIDRVTKRVVLVADN